MSEATRVVDFVRRWSDRQPERVCLTFHERANHPVRVTYGTLWDETLACSRGLSEFGLAPGDPVLIFARTSREFVAAFLAVQHAGLLAIPCPPPAPLETGHAVRQRIAEILTQSHAAALLDPVPRSEEILSDLEAPGVAILDWASLCETAGTAASVAGAHCAFAYCQFTSGSGGRAKGVRLTHDNLLAFMRARTAAYGLGETDVGVSWLPLFHDMGLVGYVLHPLVSGLPVHLMPTATFLARPASWLSLMTRERGTLSVAPNSAYGLAARKVSDAELALLDLSGWRMAFNGSEPVTREVVEAFTRRFAPVGFSAEAMLPAYGLAENTLTACSRRPGEGARLEEVSRGALADDGVARLAESDEARRTMVSVGRPLPHQEIAILDGEGALLGERGVGEVVLRGPSVMHSYLPGTEGDASTRPDGWLATGDLGYLADGELFLVGRKKDLIIRAGRNYYPEDLENAASRVPGVRPGRAVAFSVPGPDRERVVLAVETRPDWTGGAEALRAALEQAVFAASRFRPDDVLLLAPHALPLTSSGKVMRPTARHLYETAAWGEVHRAAP